MTEKSESDDGDVRTCLSHRPACSHPSRQRGWMPKEIKLYKEAAAIERTVAQGGSCIAACSCWRGS